MVVIADTFCPQCPACDKRGLPHMVRTYYFKRTVGRFIEVTTTLDEAKVFKSQEAASAAIDRMAADGRYTETMAVLTVKARRTK